MKEALKKPAIYIRTGLAIGSSALALFGGDSATHYEGSPGQATERLAAIETAVRPLLQPKNASAKETKPRPGDVTYELGGHDVSVMEVADRAKSLGRNVKVYERPLHGLGGNAGPAPKPKDITPEWLGKVKEEVDNERVAEFKKQYSNHFETALQLQNGLRVNVYSFEGRHNKLEVNPQGFSDMINFAIAMLPHMPDSEFKPGGMEFLKLAKAGKLGNVQANFFLSALPTSCLDKKTDRFRKVKSVAEAYRYCYAWALEKDSSGGFIGGKRKFFNLPFAVGHLENPTTESRTGLKLKDTESVMYSMHEFGHGILSVTGYHSYAKGGYDTEHKQFVVPLSEDATQIYAAAIQMGLAKTPFKYVQQ